MCLNADEVNPLCDDCFAKEKEGKVEGAHGLCAVCRELMTRYCWCCMTSYPTAEEARIEDGICKSCRDEPSHRPSAPRKKSQR